MMSFPINFGALEIYMGCFSKAAMRSIPWLGPMISTTTTLVASKHASSFTSGDSARVVRTVKDASDYSRSKSLLDGNSGAVPGSNQPRERTDSKVQTMPRQPGYTSGKTYVPPTTMKAPTSAIRPCAAYVDFSVKEPDRMCRKSCIHSTAGNIKLKGAKHRDPAKASR